MLEFGSLGSGGAGGAGPGGPWEEILDRDWLPDNEVRFLLPPTPQTRYKTKVFQQSVTILIKLQPNSTRGAAAVAERGVGVGPWRVSEEQLPVLVGSITGASLLLLLLLSLLLYTVCHHHRPTHKNYSVKSDVSSVTSGRTQGSPPSLSRDSLVVVTHAVSGQQACLLADRDSSLLDLPYECNGCCCDPPCDLTCNCECQGDADDDEDEEEEENEEDEDEDDDDDDDDEDDEDDEDEDGDEDEEDDDDGADDGTRRSSFTRRESAPREGQVTPGSHRIRPGHSSSSSLMTFDLTLPRRPRRGSTGRRDSNSSTTTTRPLEGVMGLPVCLEARLDEQSASSSALESVCPSRDGCLGSPCIDDTFRTRSLPAWVRSKTRPLAALDDLTPICEKPHWSKRRRNRMRSDAAAIIALTKSRGRLLSPAHPSAPTPSRPHSTTTPTSAGGGGVGAGTASAPQPTDTDALVENEAVVVYDERTAL